MSRFQNSILICTLAVGLSAFVQGAPAQKPDNTKTNKGDTGPTADQQKNRSDDEISRQIRKAITDDKEMSTYAKNVKVITMSGMVTLRGPVRSEDEKKSIESKAVGVAGASNVKNELQVAPKPKKNL